MLTKREKEMIKEKKKDKLQYTPEIDQFIVACLNPELGIASQFVFGKSNLLIVQLDCYIQNNIIVLILGFLSNQRLHHYY